MVDGRLIILLWIPVCTFAFAMTRPVQAVTLAYVLGWLLLPVDTFPIPGFWELNKVMATNAGVMLGSLMFQPGAYRRFRPHWADLMLLVFCGSGTAASLTNGLGLHDGVSRFGYLFLLYGMPYVAGRLFLRSREDLYAAARLIVTAAAAYALLAIWEWRMSPQLHATLYGSFPHSWGQHVRWGFYRPILFFPHALALGVFFAWTALLGVYLWRAGQLRGPWGLPAWTLAALPVIGLLTSLSFGPWCVFLAGAGLLLLWQRMRREWVLALPMVFAVGWMGMRYAALDDGRWLTSLVTPLSEERAASLQYRIDAETLLVAHAKARSLFGWGTWGRNRAFNADGIEVATDGLWVIILGTSGLVGLASFYLWLSGPILMRPGTTGWMRADWVVGVLHVSIGLMAANLIFNAFLSPVLTMMCGCLVRAAQESPRTRSVASPTRLAAAGRRMPPRPSARAGGHG